MNKVLNIIDFIPKYLRIYGDLHLEFGNPFRPKKDDRDQDTALFLVGDIGKARHSSKMKASSSLMSFLIEMSPQYGAVVVIFGNHEYYSDSIGHAVQKARALLKEQGCDNVYILDNDVLMFGDKYRVIGSTLWGDFMNGNPTALWESSQKMNDYKYIRVMSEYGVSKNPSVRRFKVDDALALNRKAKIFLRETVAEPFVGDTFVLTHHCPSYNLIQEPYRSNKSSYYLNGSYASNMDDLIAYGDIAFWAWGHTHDAKIIDEDNRVLLTNSYGYYGENNKSDFKPDLILDAATRKVL